MENFIFHFYDNVVTRRATLLPLLQIATLRKGVPTLLFCVSLFTQVGKTVASSNNQDIFVERLLIPEQCDTFAERGDTLSIMYTEKIGDGATSDARRTMITLGDPGINQGWNEGLPGACQGERRKLIVPALKAYRSPPPHITTNVNITYEINIIHIWKPERSPVIEELFEEMLFTTRIMVTEEVEDSLSPEGEEEEGIRTDNAGHFDDKDKKTGTPKDQKKDTSVFLYLQLVAVPVVILLLAVLIYHIYKIKHPHKRTTFFRRNEVSRHKDVPLGMREHSKATHRTSCQLTLHLQ